MRMLAGVGGMVAAMFALIYLTAGDLWFLPLAALAYAGMRYCGQD